jgi:uncharacterized membrane protein YiaA
MRKKTIAIFFIIGVAIAVIGGIIYGVGLAGAINSSTVAADGTVTNLSAGLAGTAVLGLVILLVGSVFSLVAWIGSLIATAKLSSWGWFVCVLLLNGLGVLIYLIAGPALFSATEPRPAL